MGKNLKPRPVVIYQVKEDQSEFAWVAVTGEFSDPLPDNWVALPWDGQRPCRSGLTKPSVAKTEWRGTASREAIVKVVGWLRTLELARITRAVTGN
jgi:hypothetical protein